MKYVLLFLISIFYLSCTGFGSEFNYSDTKAFDQSPTAPEIISDSSASSRTIYKPEEQIFGVNFLQIKYAGLNYNSMISTVDPLISGIGGREPDESVNWGPFNKLWIVAGGSGAYFENSDSTRSSTLSVNGVFPDPEISEIRQFDAFFISEDENYKYSRSIFCWPIQPTAGVDITEVWEYPDRKEVCVTMYYDGNTYYYKYLSVTETSTELQRTSLLQYKIVGVSDPQNEISNLAYIGYIDFSLASVIEDDYSNHIDFEDDFLNGYPSFSYLEDIIQKSVTFSEAKELVLDGYSSGFFPFVGFEDKFILY